jgi:hypothetical protein
MSNPLLLEAANPATPGARLKLLASHGEREVRALVAANPNTPTETLLHLAAHLPEAVLQNPVLDLLLIENPNLFSEMPAYARQSLLASPEVPQGFLRWVSKKGDEAALLALTQNPSTRPEMLEGLFKHVSGKVAETAKLHRAFEAESDQKMALLLAEVESDSADLYDLLLADLIPDWLIPRLAREPDVELRRALARHPRTPADVLGWLRADEDEEVRKNAAANPRTSPEAMLFFERLEQGEQVEDRELLALSRGQLWARQLVAQCAGASVELLEGLAQDQAWQVRQVVATNSKLGPQWLEALSRDSDRDVRQAVAANPNTPPAVLEHLLGDETEEVRQSARKNPQVPLATLQLLERLEQGQTLAPEILESLAAQSDWGRRLAANNPGASQDLLFSFREHPDWHTRLGVAKNPTCPAATLETLSRDTDPDVRQAVGSHPSSPATVLEALLRDDNYEVRRSIARNPQAPQPILQQLVADDHWLVRQDLAQNPSTPAELLLHLSQDSDRDVRQAAALHPNLPPQALAPLFEGIEGDWHQLYKQLLKQDPDVPAEVLNRLSLGSDWAKRLVAAHPATPEPILEELSRHQDWNLRRLVALNPALPGPALTHLLTDPDADVRQAVARYPRLQLAQLERLAQDDHLEVRRLCIQHPQVTPQILAYLALDEDENVRQAVLDHPQTPKEAMEQLRQVERLDATLEPAFLAGLAQRGPWAKKLAALNPSTSSEVLSELVADTDWQVRQALAKNPAAPVETLAQLLSDSDRDVRQAVAEHPQTPPEVLGKLLLDGDQNVRRSAAANPSLDPLTRGQYHNQLLSRGLRSRWPFNRAVALSNPNTPISELRKVRHLHATDWMVRLALVHNPSTPPEILRRLSMDGNRLVAKAAKERVQGSGLC